MTPPDPTSLLAANGLESLDDLISRSGLTVSGLLEARSRHTPDATALWERSRDGRWLPVTWKNYHQASAAIACGLRHLGLARGDRIGIMAPSCAAWDYAQMGILAAGGVAIGLDQNAADEHTRTIAEQCRLIGVVLDNPACLERLGDAVRQRLRFIVYLRSEKDTEVTTLDRLITETRVEDSWNSASPDDIATIIFTSGTTGEPKGIEYSHRQMCLAAASVLSAFPDIAEGSRLACWLPLSNLFQRMINLCAIARGAETYYVPDPREIMRLVPDIAPHIFIGVPRFYEKLYSGMQDAIAKAPRWQQRMAAWAWRIGDRRATALRAGNVSSDNPTPHVRSSLMERFQWWAADRLVLRRLKRTLGDNLHFLISGSAPMPVWLLERFHALGLPILEAYGLSENIIPVALNRPDQFRFGTVGRPLPGCEVRLAVDGELLVRGPGVFKGYLGDDKGTDNGDARIDAEGFLRSGDFASIDDQGFITLVGRKSEIFKTSTGRRVAPGAIESHLRQICGVEFAVVFGAGRPQPTALLVINETAWHLDPESLAERIRKQAVEALSSLAPYLYPAGLALTTRMPTIAGGELTANLKMRRSIIEDRYAPILAELHARLDEAGGVAFDVLGPDGLTRIISL